MSARRKQRDDWSEWVATGKPRKTVKTAQKPQPKPRKKPVTSTRWKRTTGEYLTKEVSDMTGATVRQLQWWHEQEIVIPRVEGHRRLYTQREIDQVRKLLSIRRVHKIHFKNLPKFDGEIRIISKPTVIGGVLVIPRKP